VVVVATVAEVAAAVAPVVVATVAEVAAASVNFFSHNFQKTFIANENELTHMVAEDVAAGVRSRPDSPDTDAAGTRGGGG
jgi:hypothetical protein